MEFAKKPKLDIAKKSLPEPLYRCLEYIFNQKIFDCILVGGTALSGFYAGHRRSDDIDLFTKDDESQKATILAVKSLKTIGIEFHEELQTNQYYRTTCQFQKHRFTIDVVNDPNIFQVGNFEKLDNGIVIADLETLLMTKAATLVSRCGEKDLYDLIWLFDHIEGLDFQKLIDSGKKIDGGVNGEAMLLAISGAHLREEACDFSLSPPLTKKTIHQRLLKFQKELTLNLSLFLKDQPSPPLKKLIKKIRGFSKQNWCPIEKVRK